MAQAAHQVQYEEGELLIEGPVSRMRLRWKPEPTAEERLASRTDWQPFVPDFRLLKPADPLPANAGDAPIPVELETKEAAFAAFRADFDPALLSPVERFTNLQWPLLLLLRECPHVLDLTRANPVLAWCLANHRHFHKRTPDSALRLAVLHSRQKQRDILAWLGFPETESAVRLMAKIIPEAASPSLLNGLKFTLCSSGTPPPCLTHLARLNAGVLALVGSGLLSPFVTTRLLEEVSRAHEEDETPHTAIRLMDILLMRRDLRAEGPMPLLRSTAQVAELLQDYDRHHDRVRIEEEQARIRVERLRIQVEANREAARRRAQAVRARREATRARTRVAARIASDRRWQAGFGIFPMPPVPGSDTIIPLTSIGDLVQESEAQCNCVRSYANRVADGATYIYRVLKPERATLSLVLRHDGTWRVSELKAHANGRVQYATLLAVERWLAANRVAL